MTEKRKAAFLVATPLHIFNVINFVLNDEMNSRNNSDIYIYGAFRNSKTIAEEVYKSGVFSNVYYIRPFFSEPKEAEFRTRIRRSPSEKRRRTLFGKLKKSKLHTAIMLFFPKIAIKKYASNNINFHVRYSYIGYFTADLFALNCLRCFEHEFVIGLDDGLSSYFENKLYRTSKNVLLCNRYLYQNKLIEPFRKLYLNSPELYHGELTNIIYKLPDFTASKEIRDTLFKVFQYKENNLYRTNQKIFLTQPFSEHYKFESEKKILELLNSSGSQKLLVRVHPRQKADDFSAFHLDRLNNMWELECLEQITDKSILFGVYSTAQIFPKLLFDKEPYLVFLYKILFDDPENNTYCRQASSIIPRLKGLYRDKEKIRIPSNFEELERTLNEWEDKNFSQNKD